MVNPSDNSIDEDVFSIFNQKDERCCFALLVRESTIPLITELNDGNPPDKEHVSRNTYFVMPFGEIAPGETSSYMYEEDFYNEWSPGGVDDFPENLKGSTMLIIRQD